VVDEQFVYLIGGFYHESQGGQAIEQVEVYYLNGTQVENNNVTSMLTPRGYLSSIVVDNRFVVAAGGSTSIDSEPLSIVEVLDTQTGEWSKGSAELPFNCSNPQLALFGHSSIVVMCAYLETVSVVNITGGLTYDLPSLPQPACDGGAIGAVDQSFEGLSYSNPTLLYFWFNVSFECTFLLDSSMSWRVIKKNLFQWQSIPIQYPISVINPELSMFSSNFMTPFFVFKISNNSLKFSPCVVVDYCFGQLFYVNVSNQFVCIEDVSSEQHVTSFNGGNDDEEATNQSIYESSWSMQMGNAQGTGQGLGKWDCYPLNNTEALMWYSGLVQDGSNVIITNSTPNSVIYIGEDAIYSVDSTDGSLENRTSIHKKKMLLLLHRSIQLDSITLSPYQTTCVLWVLGASKYHLSV